MADSAVSCKERQGLERLTEAMVETVLTGNSLRAKAPWSPGCAIGRPDSALVKVCCRPRWYGTAPVG